MKCITEDFFIKIRQFEILQCTSVTNNCCTCRDIRLYAWSCRQVLWHQASPKSATAGSSQVCSSRLQPSLRQHAALKPAGAGDTKFCSSKRYTSLSEQLAPKSATAGGTQVCGSRPNSSLGQLPALRSAVAGTPSLRQQEAPKSAAVGSTRVCRLLGRPLTSV